MSIFGLQRSCLVPLWLCVSPSDAGSHTEAPWHQGREGKERGNVGSCLSLLRGPRIAEMGTEILPVPIGPIGPLWISTGRLPAKRFATPACGRVAGV